VFVVAAVANIAVGATALLVVKPMRAAAHRRETAGPSVAAVAK
jgi:hypothetical protein